MESPSNAKNDGTYLKTFSIPKFGSREDSFGNDSHKVSDGDILRKKTLKKESQMNLKMESKSFVEHSIDDSSNLYDDSKLPLNDANKTIFDK